MAKKFLSKSDKKKAAARTKAHLNPKPKGKKGGASTADKKAALDALTAAMPKERDYSFHLKTASELKKKVTSANGAYRAALKVAKEVGIDPSVITATLAWANKDAESLQMYFRQLAECFKAARIPIQLDMFDETNICREAQIYDDGFRSGLAGKSAKESPHAANTRAGQVWLYAYAGGQAELAQASFGGNGNGKAKPPKTKAPKKAKASDGDAPPPPSEPAAAADPAETTKH